MRPTTSSGTVCWFVCSLSIQRRRELWPLCVSVRPCALAPGPSSLLLACVVSPQSELIDCCLARSQLVLPPHIQALRSLFGTFDELLFPACGALRITARGDFLGKKLLLQNGLKQQLSKVWTLKEKKSISVKSSLSEGWITIMEEDEGHQNGVHATKDSDRQQRLRLCVLNEILNTERDYVRTLLFLQSVSLTLSFTLRMSTFRALLHTGRALHRTPVINLCV